MKYKVKYLSYSYFYEEYEICELELEPYEFQDALRRLMRSERTHVMDVTEENNE